MEPDTELEWNEEERFDVGREEGLERFGFSKIERSAMPRKPVPDPSSSILEVERFGSRGGKEGFGKW